MACRWEYVCGRRQGMYAWVELEIDQQSTTVVTTLRAPVQAPETVAEDQVCAMVPDWALYPPETYVEVADNRPPWRFALQVRCPAAMHVVQGGCLQSRSTDIPGPPCFFPLVT